MSKCKCYDLLENTGIHPVETPILDRIVLLQEQQADKEQVLAEKKAEYEEILGQVRKVVPLQRKTRRLSQEHLDLERRIIDLKESIEQTEQEVSLLTETIQQMGEMVTPEILLLVKTLYDADQQWELDLLCQIADAWNQVHKLIREFKAHREDHDGKMKQVEATIRSLHLRADDILYFISPPFRPIHLRDLSWHMKRCLDVTFSTPLNRNSNVGQFIPDMLLHAIKKGNGINPLNGTQSN